MFGASSSTTCGGDRHMPPPRILFWAKFDFEQLLFEAFFYVMRIFGNVEPQSELPSLL